MSTKVGDKLFKEAKEVDEVDRVYYSWPCVDNNNTANNAANWCQSPWRFPNSADFETLESYSDLRTVWGYGGRAEGSSISYTTTYGFYWSSENHATNDKQNANTLVYSSDNNDNNGDPYLSYHSKYLGMQVRCVRNVDN
jgi:hypothetical protein